MTQTPAVKLSRKRTTVALEWAALWSEEFQGSHRFGLLLTVFKPSRVQGKFWWRSFPSSSALRSSWQTAPVHPSTSWKWPWIINSRCKLDLKTQLISRSSNWLLASPLCPWSSVWPTASLAFLTVAMRAFRMWLHSWFPFRTSVANP